MSWEPLTHGRYYYRSVRVGGLVKKQYLGRGQAAQDAAEEDRLKRTERAANAAATRQELQQLDQIAEPLEQFDPQFKTLLKASLIKAGYHCHHGCWRKQKA